MEWASRKIVSNFLPQTSTAAAGLALHARRGRRLMSALPRGSLDLAQGGRTTEERMKIGLRLSVAIASIAFTLGMATATAQPYPCSICYTNYRACQAAGTSEGICFGTFSRCMRGAGCALP